MKIFQYAFFSKDALMQELMGFRLFEIFATSAVMFMAGFVSLGIDITTKDEYILGVIFTCASIIFHRFSIHEDLKIYMSTVEERLRGLKETKYYLPYRVLVAGGIGAVFYNLPYLLILVAFIMVGIIVLIAVCDPTRGHSE
jgi:hypothetical protein